MRRLAQRLVGDQWADDVLQEALANAWRSRARFDPAVGRARSWLLAIVANQARSHHHRYRRWAAAHALDNDRSSNEADDSSRIDVAAVLAKLTTRQRTAIALHYYLGLGVVECGEVLGCSPGTVKSTLSDARKRLRHLLGEDYR